MSTNRPPGQSLPPPTYKKCPPSTHSPKIYFPSLPLTHKKCRPMKSPSIPGFPIWLFHINLSIYFIYIYFKSWVFVRRVVTLHLLTLGISSKIYISHCIGFLQMCKPLKKAKALELRITLWHVTYMWLFHLLVCWIIFFLIQEVFWKDNLRNKNYHLKV